MLESLKTDLLAAQTVVKKKAKSPAVIEALEKCLKTIKDRETAPEATTLDISDYVGVCALMSELKGAQFLGIGVSLLLKVLQIEPIVESKDLKSLIGVLDKVKADIDEDSVTKYLQVCQYLCSKEIVSFFDLDCVKKMTECCYTQLNRKNPVAKNIASAVMTQTNQALFHHFSNQLLEADKSEPQEEMGEEKKPPIPTSFAEIVIWICELSLNVIEEKGPKWVHKGDDLAYDLAFDSLLNCIDILGHRLLDLEQLKHTIGKEYIFYLQISLRKLKENHESDNLIKLIRGLYLSVKKLNLGWHLLIDSFTYLKVKKYSILTYLTFCIWNKLMADPDIVVHFFEHLTANNKFYEVDNTCKTIAASISKRLQTVDKYVEPPIRPAKVFDLNSKIDKSVPVTDQNIAQSFFELISTLFETFYKKAENLGMNLDGPVENRHLEPQFKLILETFSDLCLMCYDLIGANIMGDYYLNTRNTNIQKMIKLSLYYGLEDLTQKVLSFIAKECLFQMNCSDDVIQKVMMTSKIAINIGQCLPELQTINTWYSILEFLESLNQNLKKYQKHISQADKSQNTASKVIMKSQNTFNADVGITLGSITNLFELSQGFSDKQIVFLMNSLVRIVTEHLEAKHKRNKNELPSENELISQQNLCVIWKANIGRIELISSETKNILTAYLCHSRIPYKEYGIVRVLELTKLLLARKEEKVIDFSILILDIVKAQILADETSKLFEFFLTELSTFFENLTEECPQRLWEEILSFLTVGLQNKTVTSKHYDKLFKIVSTVGNHKIRTLTKSATILFVELLDLFRAKSDNKNYSYTCIDMLWTISDTVIHTESLKYETDIWNQIFKKLCLASTSPDSQARHSALQNFSDLLFNYGDEFTEELWQYALYELFFRLFDDVMEIYLNLRLQKGGDAELATPEAIQNMKSNFESQKLKRDKGNLERMISHHSGEKLDLLWEETFQIVIRSFSKIAKKYLARFGGKVEEGKSQAISKKIFDSIFFTLRLTEREIFNEGIRGLKVILSSNSEGLVLHKKDLLNIMEQIPKYLSREVTEAELAKVRQLVVPEVYTMLESFVDSARLFRDETMTETFFNIFYKLVFFPAISFVDKFKIFLEERYISLLIKKLPDALLKNGPIFADHYCRFMARVLDTKIENSMANVILCNMMNKFADVFNHSRQLAVQFPPAILEVTHRVFALADSVRDKKYVELVRASKNYKEMLWLYALQCFAALVDATFNHLHYDAQQAAAQLASYQAFSAKTRSERIANFDLIRQENSKEFAMYLIHIPKTLQKMVILTSQMKDRPDEQELLRATGEIQKTEDFLQAGVFEMYKFDQECTNLLARYCKTLLEANHRIMAAICSDHQKASEAYSHLISKYNHTFLEFLKQTAKPHSKAEENIREDVVNALANLATIKMEPDRAQVFLGVAGLEKKHLDKFGSNFCFVPMILDNLLNLIKSDDYTIRDAASNFLKELFTV